MLKREGKIEGVVRGKNGRLFLGTQGGFDFDLFTGGTPFNPPLLEIWKRTLRRRARELRRRGVPFVFVLVPDAHSVCREDLPEGVDPNFISPGEVFLAAMGELEGVIFVDVCPDLMAAKGGLDIYKRTDSHWTHYGAFVGYQTFYRAVAQVADITQIAARDVEFRYRRFFGDLGVLVEPEQSEETLRAKILRHRNERLYESEGLGRVGVVESWSPTARPCRALVFRDSFMTDQFEFIANSFSNVLTVGTTTSLFLDAVDQWKPDVVVSQVGERRLFAYESDHRAATFDDVFRSDYSSELGRKAQRAMLLLRAGDVAGAEAEIEIFNNEAALGPDHAYVGAQIYLAAQNLARARAYIDSALATHPERPSYLALKAQTCLALGEQQEALRLAAQAVEVAGYNGYYHELYAYALIATQNLQQAGEHLDEVVTEIDDSGILWYWTSVAREAQGDRVGAAEAIHQTMLLGGSESEVYREQAAKFATEAKSVDLRTERS